jgi:hypothetical protein
MKKCTALWITPKPSWAAVRVFGGLVFRGDVPTGGVRDYCVDYVGFYGDLGGDGAGGGSVSAVSIFYFGVLHGRGICHELPGAQGTGEVQRSHHPGADDTFDFDGYGGNRPRFDHKHAPLHRLPRREPTLHLPYAVVGHPRQRPGLCLPLCRHLRHGLRL